MATGVRDKYNVALNGKGYMLRGAPNNPAYRRDEVPTAISRLAGSDLQYSDFSGSGNFFVAQTDWSGGFKDTLDWVDDAKYFFSTNIDAYSEPGVIKLAKALDSVNDFSEDIYCGSYETIGSSSYKYVGTEDDGGGKPSLYRDNSGWTDIISAYIPTSAERVCDAMSHKGSLWVITQGDSGASTYAVFKAAADGSGQTDYTAAIATATGFGAVTGGTAMISDESTLYVAVQQFGSNNFAIVKTVDAGANWVLVKAFAYNGIVASMALLGNFLYYFVEPVGSATYELRAYDLVNSLDVSLSIFRSASLSSIAAGSPASRRAIRAFRSSKIIITIPNGEIWQYSPDTGELKNLLIRDNFKHTTLAAIAGESSWVGGVPSSYPFKGCVEHDRKLWWGNLVWDGEIFNNTIKNSADTANTWVWPLFSNGAALYWVDTVDKSILWGDSSNYRATADKNYLVLCQMSQVVSIDKLLFNISVLFEPLVTNQRITIEYLTGELTASATWTALPTMTVITEGSTGNKRDFFIPNSVIYNKLWVRIKLDNNGQALTTTAKVKDIVVGYKPIPNYKNRWQVRLEMSDGVKLLNRQDDQRKGDELQAGIWNEKAAKQIVLFEDIDYVDCTMRTAMTSGQVSASVDSTKNFPRRGRVRAVSGGVAEEMIYTSAESNKILGISRGQRGTRARAYLSGQVLKNDYSVYIEKLQSEINWTDEKKTEHIATAVLLEA